MLNTLRTANFITLFFSTRRQINFADESEKHLISYKKLRRRRKLLLLFTRAWESPFNTTSFAAGTRTFTQGLTLLLLLLCWVVGNTIRIMRACIKDSVWKSFANISKKHTTPKRNCACTLYRESRYFKCIVCVSFPLIRHITIIYIHNALHVKAIKLFV